MSFKKIQVVKLSSNFREATRIIDVPFTPLAENEILVKVHFTGINASDINYTSGRYLPGVKPPFDAGFECLGKIEKVGSNVTKLKVGDTVAYTGFGCFAEYLILKSKTVKKMPFMHPEIIPLLVSGLTASLSLEQVGNVTLPFSNDVTSNNDNQREKIALVTAAAGGTGMFAVQLLKLSGYTVIGTCGSAKKQEFLRSIGCDLPVNYKTENLQSVIKTKYPQGLDLVYESIGGQMFEQAVNCLAVNGKIIVIGLISKYQDQSAFVKSANDRSMNASTLSMKLLAKSASIQGFFLNHFLKDAHRHMKGLITLLQEQKLQSTVNTDFCGIESVPEAIDYMYQGKNIGKLIVDLSKPYSPNVQSRL